MATRVLIANNAKSLGLELSAFRFTATVEAQYGHDVVHGTAPFSTLLLHSPQSGNICPCMTPNWEKSVDAIGISHLDLVALGGVMAVLGLKPDMAKGFWMLAAFINTQGLRNIRDFHGSASVLAYEQINAFWAWSETRKVFAPHDGSVGDVTEEVLEYAKFLRELEQEGETGFRLENGRDWVRNKRHLEAESYRTAVGNVLLRESDCYVNNLFSHGNQRGYGVVSYNPSTQQVTLSVPTSIDGVNCCTIAKNAWGSDVIGDALEAQSPKGMKLTILDADDVAKILSWAIYNAIA